MAQGVPRCEVCEEDFVCAQAFVQEEQGVHAQDLQEGMQGDSCSVHQDQGAQVSEDMSVFAMPQGASFRKGIASSSSCITEGSSCEDHQRSSQMVEIMQSHVLSMIVTSNITFPTKAT